MTQPRAETEDSIAVFDELAPIFERLDLLIQAASGQALVGNAGADPYRGLYVAPEDVTRLLQRPAGVPAFDAPLPETWPPLPVSRLALLQSAFALTAFDLDLLLIALAPELDLRYERLYAFLQDDVTRRKPTVDLALNLLCRTAAEKLARRAHVDAASPLLNTGLLRLVPDPNHLQPPLLSHYLQADPQIIRWLFRQDGLDPRLRPFCTLNAPLPPAAGLDLGRIQKLANRFIGIRTSTQTLLLHFHGTAGIGKRETAQHAAALAATPLLLVDLGTALDTGIDLQGLLPALFREAVLRGAALYFDGIDALREPGRASLRNVLFEAAAAHPGAVIAAGQDLHLGASGSAVDWLPMHFPMPDFAQRRAGWTSVLEDEGAALGNADLDQLAGRFKLTPKRLRNAARLARGRARERAAVEPRLTAAPDTADLMAAVRAQSGQELAGIARKVETANRWPDLLLPAEPLTQLQELCAQARQYQRVHGDWGFGAKLGHGRGISALFSGGSGTGKTMAAGIIANDLGLDLYRIDLSQVVNKYIGETEKNLERVFTAAEAANAILFFDEADSLFGKRSDVKDAHDRYANLEVSYLLQKMEEYEGLAILATNLRQNLDDAFLRRLSVIVDFPFPDEEQRLGIWQVLFPAKVPLAADVDFASLAREVGLSGGHLRNIALAAAFLASEDGSAVAQAHLWRAVRREYQKLGRSWSGPG